MIGSIFYSVFFVIDLLIQLAVYGLTAFSLYRIAKNNQIRYAWLAWIPFVQFSLIGAVIEEYRIFNRTIPHAEWIILLLSCSGLISTFVPFFGWAIALAMNLLRLLFLHKFFTMLAPERAGVYTLLCVFGNIPLAIILFLCRDRQLWMSPGSYRYPF